MPEVSMEQIRKELDIAFNMITKLADNGTKLSTNIRNLASQLEAARGETTILLKVVAHILGREALQDRNPTRWLEARLNYLSVAADVFASTSDDGSSALREAGIPVPELTQEAKDEIERDAAISESYRSLAAALRDEALKVIVGVGRRT